MTGATGTLRANPAERPIYLAFTPNFSAVRMAPRPSSSHWHGSCRTAENPRTKTDVCYPPIYVRCPSRSRRSGLGRGLLLLTQSGERQDKLAKDRR